jgi:hypothetical protein
MLRKLLACLICAAFAAPASAAVVVIGNNSNDAISFELKPDSGEKQSEKLAPGEARAFACDKTAVATFTSTDKQNVLELDAYSVYVFTSRNNTTELHGVKLEGNAPPVGNPTPATASAATHKVAVKLLVDDSERRTKAVWEPALKKRFAQAAEILKAAANVSFEVTEVGTWDADPNAADLFALQEDFKKVVPTEPMTLAIGYTSRRLQPLPNEKAVPFAAPVVALQSHLLIREGDPRSESERVEVLVQQLGRYLGAVTCPDRSSAMRPRLGDGQAVQAKFRIGFDPLNVLAMNLTADDLRTGKVKRLSDLSPTTQIRLGRIYGTFLTAVPDERLPDNYLGMLDRAGIVPGGVVPAGGVPVAPKPASPVERSAKEEAVRIVVKAVAAKAEANAKLPATGQPARLKGDALTAAYVQEAALTAASLDKEYRQAAFLLGIGLALDDSTVLRDNPITGAFCKAVETDDERRQRLVVLSIPTIRGRRDLCQHFVISAALTEMAGPELAETAGLMKEQSDMTKASGFSFADLCADFSGIEFAKRLKRDPARELAAVGKKFAVDDYVAKIDGFRDGISAERFKADFVSTTNVKFKDAYNAVWKRVRELPMYRIEKKTIDRVQ